MASLRLRLRIERNELPPVCTLWPVAPAQLKSTIAQLLENVNRTFPLESPDWGYEDYAVLIAGYECLHYHTIETVCKDEDEITIRPLQYVDLRARTMTGRDQITRDGRHLLDGVPFGRPALRGPVRPEVNIPARKRKRVELEEQDAQDERAALPYGALAQNLLANSGDERGEGQTQEDEPPELLQIDAPPGKKQKQKGGFQRERLTDRELNSINNGLSTLNDGIGASLHGSAKRHIQTGSDGAKRRQLLQAYDEDEDDESDDDFDPDAGDSDDTSASSSSDAKDAVLFEKGKGVSDHDSSDASDSEDEAFEGFPVSAPPTPRPGARPHLKKASESSEVSSESSDSDADSSSLSSDSESSSDSSPDSFSDSSSDTSSVAGTNDKAQSGTANEPVKRVEPNAAPKQVGVPYTGKQTTKSRNARRRDARELQFLKSSNVLPPNADLASLATYKTSLSNNNNNNNNNNNKMMADGQNGGASGEPVADMSAGARASEEASSTTLDHVAAAPNASTAVSIELEKRREELLAAIKNGGVDVTEHLAQKAPTKSAAEGDEDGPPEEIRNPPAPDIDGNAAMADTPEQQTRKKRDMSTTQRLIFGSLGVRNPKSKEDREKVQKKLQDRNQKHSKIEGEVLAASKDDQQLAEKKTVDWRDVLDLRAVECTDPSIKLSTPPFPFRQRWDPHQQLNRKKNKRGNENVYSAGGKKSRKLNDRFPESYDKYNTNGEGDVLDYGDEEVTEGVDPAAAQLQGEAAAGAVEDDFPPLPVDLVTLAPLNETDASVDDVITSTKLACDATTEWAPAMKTTTLKLLGKPSIGGSQWKLQLAARDVPEKVYDEHGERVYGKFEAAGFDDDEEDEQFKQLAWADLGEVRLLLRGREYAPAASFAQRNQKLTDELGRTIADRLSFDFELARLASKRLSGR